jgi:hypothetical protein
MFLIISKALRLAEDCFGVRDPNAEFREACNALAQNLRVIRRYL